MVIKTDLVLYFKLWLTRLFSSQIPLATDNNLQFLGEEAKVRSTSTWATSCTLRLTSLSVRRYFSISWKTLLCPLSSFFPLIPEVNTAVASFAKTARFKIFFSCFIPRHFPRQVYSVNFIIYIVLFSNILSKCTLCSFGKWIQKLRKVILAINKAVIQIQEYLFFP